MITARSARKPAGRRGLTTTSVLLSCAVGVLLVLVGALSVALLMRRGGATETYGPDTGPVVLQIQKLGDLHTASFTMSDVLHEETAQEPGPWAAAVPGVSEIYGWTTRNRAVVVAQGTVEAGIDLARLSASDVRPVTTPSGAHLLQIRLPPVVLYPPTVKCKVEDSRTGVLWRDENIIPKAQAHAGKLFTESAERSGIRERARVNAEEALRKLLASMGCPDVQYIP